MKTNDQIIESYQYIASDGLWTMKKDAPLWVIQLALLEGYETEKTLAAAGIKSPWAE